MANPENGGTATLKDVYEAVDNVRTELGGKIDKLTDTVNTVVTSHEHRLTVVEQSATIQDARITIIEGEVKKHSDEIADVNNTLRTDEAASAALAAAATKRQTTRRWIIGTAIGISGSIGGLLYVLIALVH